MRKRQHDCAAETASGSPCRRPAQLEPDPDGEHRCYTHTLAPAEAAKRRAAEAASRLKGVAGKRAHLDSIRVENATRRAQGLPSRAAEESFTRTRSPEVLEPATLAEQVGDFDLTTPGGRSKLLHRIAELVFLGQISPREAEAIVKVVHRAEAQSTADKEGRTVQVCFELITSRSEADAFRAAQERVGLE